MPVNSLTFNQLSTLLNGIASQATGATGIAPVNTNEFVSVAQTTLLAGADPVMSAISQILGRTIFSIRPYNAKFRGLLMDNQRWGGITRKINYVDKSFTNDSGFALTDGEAIDQYTVNKPEVVQTNYYGSNIYQKSITIFRDQLDTAFSGVDQFAEFIGGVTQNISDQIEQAHENTARMTIANLVTGIISAAKANQIVHLLTEYNAATGLELTATTVYTPANFKPFMQWVYSRIAQVSSMLTERSQKYHFNLTGNPSSVTARMTGSGSISTRQGVTSPRRRCSPIHITTTIFVSAKLRLSISGRVSRSLTRYRRSPAISKRQTALS